MILDRAENKETTPCINKCGRMAYWRWKIFISKCIRLSRCDWRSMERQNENTHSSVVERISYDTWVFMAMAKWVSYCHIWYQQNESTAIAEAWFHVFHVQRMGSTILNTKCNLAAFGLCAKSVHPVQCAQYSCWLVGTSPPSSAFWHVWIV